MTKASDNLFPIVQLDTQASTPSTPSGGTWKTYAAADGLYAVGSNGSPLSLTAGGSGNVATDAIWTTAGKVAIATGTSTATEQYPPGYEFNYTEYTSGGISVTATTEGTANTIVTAGAVTYDGSTAIIIEFYAPSYQLQATSGAHLIFYLYDGGSSIGLLAQFTNNASTTLRVSGALRRRLTPSAASHTYSIRSATGSGTATILNGTGGTGNYVPLYIRQTKA